MTMNAYKILKRQVFTFHDFSLVPIRMHDRYLIMKWRNEQIYHLRQTKELSISDQDQYFNSVVAHLFNQEQPSQLLFSYLEGNTCIGYGGLVHINWVDRNSELSFIMDTKREASEFQSHWSVFLNLIEQVAFEELALHKVYTYAYNLRPHLYQVLEANGFYREAILKEHCLYKNEFIDVVLHAKLKGQ